MHKMNTQKEMTIVAECYRRVDGTLYPTLLAADKNMLKNREFIAFTGVDVKRVTFGEVLGREFVSVENNAVSELEKVVSTFEKCAVGGGNEFEKLDFDLFKFSRGRVVIAVGSTTRFLND